MEGGTPRRRDPRGGMLGLYGPIRMSSETHIPINWLAPSPIAYLTQSETVGLLSAAPRKLCASCQCARSNHTRTAGAAATSPPTVGRGAWIIINRTIAPNAQRQNVRHLLSRGRLVASYD